MEPAGGPERIVSYISEKTISELKEYYPHILPEEIRSLPEALSRINAASGTKFIVIIDEWDVLIRDEAADLKTQEEYINFLRAMFKGTEPTKYIQLAYLTGILPVKKEKTQSALNNFKDYSMLHAGPIAPYVGCLLYTSMFAVIDFPNRRGRLLQIYPCRVFMTLFV